MVTPPATAKLVFIESERRTDVLTIDYVLSGQIIPTVAPTMVQ